MLTAYCMAGVHTRFSPGLAGHHSFACYSEMCSLRTGPIADRDPQNVSDPRTDCGSYILDGYLFAGFFL